MSNSTDEKVSDVLDDFAGGDDLGALGEQIQDRLKDEMSPPTQAFVKSATFRAEDESIPPQDSRYVLVGHMNWFPEKNTFTYDELKKIMNVDGVRVTIKK